MDNQEIVSILVVDDHPANLKAVGAVLAELGQDVVTVASGREALYQLLSRDFAVIILDVNMPDLSGFETAALIRQHPRSEHTPIVFLTALSQSEADAVFGYSVGAVDYLLTPVIPKVLRSKVRVFVDLFRMNRIMQRQSEQLATANKQLEQRLAEIKYLHEQTQALSRRVVEVQEEERRAIARELHDQAGQMLTGLMIGLGLLERECDYNEKAVTQIRELKTRTDDVLQELHQLAVSLRPPSLDKLGLQQALSHLVGTFTRQHCQRVDLVTTGLEGPRPPSQVETTVYRVVQEALTNVVRHANASHVGVIVEARDGRCIAIVEDDGIGFDAEASPAGGRLGLVGMRERAISLGGTLTIESNAGRGCTVYLDVPCERIS